MRLPVMLVVLATAAPFAAPAGSLKVTQRHLVPVCRGAAPVPAGTRSWPTDEGPLAITFTMRNQPRTGLAGADSGYATVGFTPEAGHRYEVEVRAAPPTFSERVWAEGHWAPVVRDRAVDRIVSSEPVWGAPPCPVPSTQR